MLIMETINMEETSTENTKVFDSGYSNTCSNSQSQTSTETLPKPITKRKEKVHKKKKSKSNDLTSIVIHANISQTINGTTQSPVPMTVNAVVEPMCKQNLAKKTEELAVVELVDATDPGVHNDNHLPTGSECGLASKPIVFDESSSLSTEEYYAVISMNGGLVLHATPSLHSSLGYPKDSWIGKLFIDFLDPKDKQILNERIASEITISQDFCSSGVKSRKASIFCRFRKFKGNDDDNIQYVPFRLNLAMQMFHADKLALSKNQMMLLVVSFHPVRSAYRAPDETIIPTVFTTRHTATCHLSYVDPDVVQYLGYLPQDMIDHSLFDFYYPEDLPFIKDIYETVINLENSSFRSKPYRFIVHNGGFVVLETQWSSFVNPWTKKLEVVIGQHRVLKGPVDPDIFKSPGNRSTLLANISEEVLKEAKIIEKEIMTLLAEAVQRKSTSPMTDSDLLSKKNELISFVETILQEIKSPAQIKDHMAVDERSFSGLPNPVLQEHDSVMLGEISPHHEYLDSKSSTETPPSYNQLNYHDNIERFFKSNIDVTANNGPYGSDEENLHSTTNSSDEPGKNNTSRPALQCTSSTNESGNSGSAENLSSESNNLQSFGSQGETSNTSSNNSSSNGGVKPPILTESILNKHNEDMEKLMILKHREQKKGDKRNKSSLNDKKTKADQPTPRAETNNKKTRLKRSGSKNWEADNTFNKISKYDDQKKVPQNVSQLPNTLNTKFTPTNVEASTANVSKSNPNPNFNINVWPSASMPSNAATAYQCYPSPSACPQAISRFSIFPQMAPVYYIPVQQTRRNTALSNITQEQPEPPNPLAQSAPYCYVPFPYMAAPMPNMMYPPMMGPTSAAPTAMMYGSFLVPETPMTMLPQTSYQAPTGPVIVPSTTTVVNQSSDLKQPDSKAPSEKAEPGSIKAISESSKKIYSSSAFTSSCTNNENGAFSSSINKSCNSSSNMDQSHTLSSFESSLSNLCSSNNQSSCHKSEKSMGSQTRKALGMMRREPPWIEGVSLTPELVYQYQQNPKSINEVLKSDLEFLKHSKQPNLVNEQLGQLFIDLDLEGFGAKLKLDEQGTNSASDSCSSDGSQSPSRVGAW